MIEKTGHRRCRFIGGIADGRSYEITNALQTVKIPNRSAISEQSTERTEGHVYHRRTFVDGMDEYQVFVYEHCHDPIGRLLRRYGEDFESACEEPRMDQGG